MAAPSAGFGLPLGQRSTYGGIGINTDDVDASTYGVDVLFTDDLQVTPKGDYQTITGLENLRRAILRRLIVAPGEYKLNPQYGVGIARFVKKGMTKANLDELRHLIVDNISRERRIDKVAAILVQSTFFDQDPGIVVTVSVIAKGRKQAFQPFNFTAQGPV